MGILTIKRTTMRKQILTTFAAALCLAGTALTAQAQPAELHTAEQAADSLAAPTRRPMTINEMRLRRGLTDRHNLFVPKGQWIFGGTASYSTHTNDRYQFFIIEDINSEG